MLSRGAANDNQKETVMQTIEAVFDGQVFRPASPPALLPNTRCLLTVEPMPDAEVGDVWSFLAQAAGCTEAPADWSSQHDHYLYSTPKRHIG